MTSPSDEPDDTEKKKDYVPIFEFDLHEVLALHRMLYREYIPYSDPAAHEVATKIMKIANDYELASRANTST